MMYCEKFRKNVGYEYTESVSFNFMDIAAALRNIPYSKEKITKKTTLWIEKKLEEYGLLTRAEYSEYQTKGNTKSMYFGLSYEDHYTKIIRAFENYFEKNQDEFNDFIEIGYMISLADGKPLTYDNALKLFEYYWNEQISFECLEDNIKERYYLENFDIWEYDISCIKNLYSKDEYMLWIEMNL